MKCLPVTPEQGVPGCPEWHPSPCSLNLYHQSGLKGIWARSTEKDAKVSKS